MKIKRYRSTEEKTVLTGLIVHDRVLGRIYQRLGGRPSPFKSKWSNLIADWCFDYYAKYQKAPRGMIRSLFLRYSQQEYDEDAVGIIESFLSTLSRDYTALTKELNEDYLVDLASNLFDKIQLEKMAEGISTALEREDLEEARRQFAGYQALSFEDTTNANPFSKEEVLSTLKHYEEENRSIVQFPGDLGRFLSPFLERGSFVSFAAPEKRGKSFWLLEVVWQALRNRRKVLYYVLGDMSQKQSQIRLYQRATLRPKHRRTIHFPMTLHPKGKDDKGFPTAALETESRKVGGISVGLIRRAIKKLQVRMASKQIPVRIKCAGGSIISASQIEQEVKSLTAQGWIPDVVCVDYADLLAAEPGTMRMDFRHQINETWKILRRIPLDHHCLLVTATQAAARSYDAWVIRKKDFSEDKRKNAHVTGMCGINQTSEEKRRGIYRLNWVFLRDGEWSDSQVCWTAGSLALACPCLKSAL